MADSANGELLGEIEDAVTKARANYNVALPLPTVEEVDGSKIKPAEPTEFGRGAHRVRQQVQRLGFEGINVIDMMRTAPAKARQWEILNAFLTRAAEAEFFLQDRGLCAPTWQTCSKGHDRHVPRSCPIRDIRG